MTKKPRFKRETITRKTDVASAVSEAFSDLSSLGDEMREAYDNTPESLQESGAGAARGEAADALEGLEEPDVPEVVGVIEFEYSTRTAPPREQSRAWRRDEACGLLDQAISALDEAYDKAEEANDEKLKTEIDDARSVISDLKDEAEAVEFPGMYG